MDWLSQNLDDLLGFFEISATKQVNNDLIAPEHALCECLWLLFDIEHLNRSAGYGNCILIFLNQGSHEFVSLLCRIDDKVIVTHLFEEAMSDKTIDASNDDAFSFVRFLSLLHFDDFCLSEHLFIKT